MDIAIALAVVVVSVFIIFKLNALTTKIKIRVSDDGYIDGHAKYQALLLLLASSVLLLAYLQNSENFTALFSLGDLSARVGAVHWFGIGENRTWVFAGLYLSVIITLGTLTFVFFQFRSLKVNIREVLPYMHWVIIFSLTNSFSEEAIFRLGIIVPLIGEVDPGYLILLSAIVFGLAHFGGMPHGLMGMLMAGFLGWFLAKSVVETQGIFWAWLIHFIQDIVIYIGFMVGQISRKYARENG